MEEGVVREQRTSKAKHRPMFRALGSLARSYYTEACWRALRWMFRSCVISTKQGVFCVDTKDTVIAPMLYRDRGYEWDYLCRVQNFLEAHGMVNAPRNAIIDVGANIGVIGVGLMRCGRFSAGLFIEPNKSNFLLLKQNIERNGLRSVVSRMVAVSDVNGRARLRVDRRNHGNHTLVSSAIDVEEVYEEVELRTLDDLVADANVPVSQVSVVWMDIQGHELQALGGMRRVLAGGAALVMELWPEGLRRARATPESLVAALGVHFDYFWIDRASGFVRYPLAMLEYIWNEWDGPGLFGNLVFLPRQCSAMCEREPGRLSPEGG